MLFELFQRLCHLYQLLIHHAKNRSRLKRPILISPSSRRLRQNLNPLLYPAHRPNVKLPRRHRVHHVFTQHQVLDVRLRHDYALRPRQPFNPAYIEKSLDLFVDPADRLNVPLLIHRTRHCNILPQRNSGKRRS